MRLRIAVAVLCALGTFAAAPALASATTIMEVQGAGHISPFAGMP